MRIVFFIPALRSLSGGLANIYTIARNLRALGRDVALMGPAPDAAGFSEAAQEGFCVLPWGQPLASSDIWCIPESWPNALSVGVNAGARVLVYVQNWVYMLGTLPDGVRWSTLPLDFIAVSTPVAWFMREVLALKTRAILPPVIGEEFFQAGNRPGSHVRVAFMPRKNRALAEQIQKVALAWLAEQQGCPKVEWVSIHNVTRAEAANLLASCHLFISTGFPEGFGLPPLEAMACGCVPVGFTGFGGWEYMRQAKVGELAPSYVSPHAQRTEDLSGQGNGFFFADGDTLGAGLALGRAILLAFDNSEAWQSLCGSCRTTAMRYTNQSQLSALDQIFPSLSELAAGRPH